MATVALTTTPTQIDDGTAYTVLVTNAGAVTVDLSRGGRLRPGQTATVYPEGTALTAAATSGTGSVTTSTTTKPLPNPSDPAALAARPEFSGTYARPTKVTDLAAPFVIAHRGGANIAPENSMEAFEVGASVGSDAIEGGDCYLLADGALGVMHDGTIDRTTSSSGNTTAQAATLWRTVTLDTATWFGSSVWGNLKPPFFQDVLNRFGGMIVMTPEAKNTGSGAVLAAKIARAGLQKSCIITSFILSELTAAVSAGIAACYQGTDKSAATLTAAGITWNGVDVADATVTSGYIAAMQAAGIKVIGYTVDRHTDYSAFVAKGGDGLFSNDPYYIKGPSNGYAHVVAADRFADQTYYHGVLPSPTGDRGQFTAPADYGWTATTTGTRGALQGWGSPIKKNPVADTFTINLSLILDGLDSGNTSRWASVAFGCPNDKQFNDGVTGTGANGYHALFRATGQLDLFKFTDNVGSLLVQKTTGLTAVTLGTTVVGLTITVTPSSITVARTDVPYSITSNDTTYRGGYWHLNRNGASVRFRGITIT